MGFKGGRFYPSLKHGVPLALKCPTMKGFLLGLTEHCGLTAVKTGERGGWRVQNEIQNGNPDNKNETS
jgi:hypothetical protein